MIEHYEYGSENKKYNDAFLDWRRQTKAAHIYRYTGNLNENVFVAGDAAAPPNPAFAERAALMRCGELTGAALLLFLLSELIGGTVLIALLRLFHINIRLDLLLLTMDGSQWARCAVNMVIELLKYLFPALLMMESCKIPKRLAIPIRIGSLAETLGAAGAGMIVTAVYSLFANGEGVMHAEQIFTYKDMAAVLTYGLFQMLIGSLIAEIFLRGCILTLLRQFGDPFAIVTVAFIAFLFPNTTATRISELLIGLSAGYLLVRSGSLSKCVLIRVIFTGLSYARLVVVYSNHMMQLWEYVLLLLSMGVLVCALYVRFRKEKIRLMNRTSLLSLPKKLSALILSMTMLPWTAASILLALIQIFS